MLLFPGLKKITLMYKSYKYRIYPTFEQKQEIDKTIAVCRFVYNLALETKIYTYKHFNKSLSFFDLCLQLTDAKKEFVWLREVGSQALQAELKKVDKAFRNFYMGKGYPKFKSKHRGSKAFASESNCRRVNWDDSTLTIPRIKNIPIKLSRRFYGEIRSVTIICTPTGKYFTSILVKTPQEIPDKLVITESKTIGIDLGLINFITTSTEDKIENPKYLQKSIQRLKILQKKLHRKVKGGANRKKANLKVALIHEKITNQRIDFIQKITSDLIKDNQIDSFVLEDLNIKGLISNHKLAQAINDASWGKFKDTLQYKCNWSGKNLILIDRFFPSSKTCSCCGVVRDSLDLSERIFTCNQCNFSLDRDVNAAINIKNSGLGKSGEPVELRTKVRTKKQEVIS